jgi:hypothetical protein
VRVWCRAYWAPKESCTDEEYEDAFAWCPRGRQLIGVIGDRFTFAVADGATVSSYSGLWANQLVLGFVTGKLREDNLAEALPGLSKRWLKKTPKRTQSSWWAEQSLERGAFAALVGLTLEGDAAHPGTWSWSGLAVGDSCLIHMREHSVVVSFPISRADQFGTTPVLLSTGPSAVEAALAERRTTSGLGVDGDRFYLMTDALAQWFLNESERGGEPWYALEDLAGDPDAQPFREWLTDLRRAGRIRNDDVTLLRIEVE